MKKETQADNMMLAMRMAESSFMVYRSCKDHKDQVRNLIIGALDNEESNFNEETKSAALEYFDLLIVLNESEL